VEMICFQSCQSIIDQDIRIDFAYPTKEMIHTS
jgi:hypothetical protein